MLNRLVKYCQNDTNRSRVPEQTSVTYQTVDMMNFFQTMEVGVFHYQGFLDNISLRIFKKTHVYSKQGSPVNLGTLNDTGLHNMFDDVQEPFKFILSQNIRKIHPSFQVHFIFNPVVTFNTRGRIGAGCLSVYDLFLVVLKEVHEMLVV